MDEYKVGPDRVQRFTDAELEAGVNIHEGLKPHEGETLQSSGSGS